MKIRDSIVSLLLICSCVVVASNSHANTKAQPKQDLAAGSALLVDLNNGEVLYERNADTVVAIASLTKLMTAMVALDSKQPLDQQLPIRITSNPDMRGVFSRVRVGSELSRRDMLLLALMASENRAANSLAEHHPGGYGAFIRAMNAKAQALGMRHTRFTEPTGLSAGNRSNARDLVLLLKAARQYPLIEQYSSQSEKVQSFRKPAYSLGFRNTNALVRKPDWSIQLSKTGFTNAAGRCLVMNTQMKNRQVAFVVLDAFGKYTHMADANRLKRYLETGRVTPVPAAAISYREQKLAERRRQGQ